jgi:DedD protein
MDSALKQRLLGAAVLIALAIIFLPMFFSSTPPKQENTTLGLNIPPAPERSFETRNLAVDRAKGGAPAAAATTPVDSNKVTTVTTAAPSTFEAPDAAAPKTTTAAASASAKPAPVTPPAPPPVAPTPPPAPSVQTDGRFLVNLGVYSDQGHANALVDRVKKLGLPAFAEATEYQGKTAQRVRVGPYADRAAAESVRLKIKQAEDKVPSSVVESSELPKTTAAGSAATAVVPAPTLAANRAGGYAVQVGAFKAEDEANKLRDRLRNGGVAAFIDKSSDGDQALWKVRAGPYADRGGADAALTTIKQKFQITGMVKTQP